MNQRCDAFVISENIREYVNAPGITVAIAFESVIIYVGESSRHMGGKILDSAHLFGVRILVMERMDKLDRQSSEKHLKDD